METSKYVVNGKAGWKKFLSAHKDTHKEMGNKGDCQKTAAAKVWIKLRTDHGCLGGKFDHKVSCWNCTDESASSGDDTLLVKHARKKNAKRISSTDESSSSGDDTPLVKPARKKNAKHR